MYFRGQEQIHELKEEIKIVDETYAELETKIEELDTLLLEIKKLLYDLCRLLDVSFYKLFNLLKVLRTYPIAIIVTDAATPHLSKY